MENIINPVRMIAIHRTRYPIMKLVILKAFV